MSDWIEYKLGEVINLKRGYDLSNERRNPGPYPVISSSGVTDFHSEYMVLPPGVITGRYGTIGKVFFETQPYWPLNTALYVTDFKGNDPKFIYYFLQVFDFEKFNDKSTVPGINRNHLHLEPVSIPSSVHEQQSIASILSSLDDKIDLLHRQNKTLEAMAETLFRKWFVEEAKEEWEEKKLGDVTDIGIGRTPPRKESQWFTLNSSDIKWISIKDMGKDGAFIFNTSEYLTQAAVEQFNIPIIPKDTVVLSFKMTVGRVAITDEQMLSNEAIAHFKFRDDTPFTKEYLYLFLKSYQYETLGSTSSIVTSINSAMIKDMIIQIPEDKTMNRFQEITETHFDRIKSNQLQIRSLAALRDTLLPKLMSGEVKTV